MKTALVREVLAVREALVLSTGYARTQEFIQHGDVTVWAHCFFVACVALQLAEILRLTVDRKSLVRGALLHDYFLYDWHDGGRGHRLHGFTHPGRALQNAERELTLTPTERNVILRHMFPLTPIPPTCREAWLVTLADKICALQETFRSTQVARLCREALRRAESA